MAEMSIEALQFYEENPIDFCEDLLGVELDEWQKTAFENLYNDRFVAIKAGSGVGKTVWMSLATMHFLATKPFSKVPTTAPSQHQLEDLLWAEHHKNISRSDYLSNLLVWTQRKVAVKKYEPQWYAVARTARVSPGTHVAEGLQGFHAEDNLLYVLDESSGIPDDIFPAVEGALTGKHAHAILAANPTRLTGYFHAVFTEPRMKGMYKLMTVSCEDSKFIEPRYLQMMEARYGRNHPVFRIKVLGEFPTSDVELLFPVADVELMRNNELIDMRGKRDAVEIGIDIGLSTARSVMCIRKGLRVMEWRTYNLVGNTADAAGLTQWILTAINAFEPASVKIDANGVGGTVFGNLALIYPRLVHPVIGQAQPAETKKSRFGNLRAQGYWELREMLTQICSEFWPKDLIDEMSDIRYSMPNGRIMIQPKEKMKVSPDYTDALVYAFLDSDVCVDKYNQLVIPVYVGDVNDSLTRVNPFTKGSSLSRNSGMVAASKWSRMHG
jgi:phage terminase large subunit